MTDAISKARRSDLANVSYRAYCRVAAVAFAVITIYGLTAHVIRQDLATDWFHSVLHLMSAIVGAYSGWMAAQVILARLFTWTIAILYLGLGIYGWFTPGLFMNSVIAIPLSAGDNVVHLLLSVPALVIITRHLGAPRRFNAASVNDHR